MELIKVTLSAGEVKQFRRGGSSVEIIDSTYAVTLNFYTPTGAQINTVNGALSGLYLNADFGAFDLVNGSTAQSVTLLVCDQGENGGSRRQPGTVSVIDTNKFRTLSRVAFTMPGTAVAVAAQYSRIGLWMPAASANRAIIERISFSTSGAAAQIDIAYGTAAAATTDSITRNKLLNDSGASAALRAYDSTAAYLGGYSVLSTFKASTKDYIEPKTPIVLKPGSGLLVCCATANQDISANIDFFEEANT